MISRLMKLTTVIFPVILSLFLVGCVDAALMGARWVQEMTYVQQAGFARVHEIHDFRRWLRELCKDSLQRSINRAIQEGDETALRELLSAHYPGLVTTTVIRQIQENSLAVGDTASECTPRTSE